MILVLGDAHARDEDDRAAPLSAYAVTDVEVALQVGDLQWYDLPVETWFSRGTTKISMSSTPFGTSPRPRT